MLDSAWQKISERDKGSISHDIYGWRIIPFQAVCLSLRSKQIGEHNNGHGWWITSATPIHTKLYRPSSSQSSQGRMQAAAPRQASQVKSRAVEPHRIRSEVDSDQVHDQEIHEPHPRNDVPTPTASPPIDRRGRFYTVCDQKRRATNTRIGRPIRQQQQPTMPQDMPPVGGYDAVQYKVR